MATEEHALREYANTAPLSDITMMFSRRNQKMRTLVQNAVLKTLLHAIQRGSIEGVRVAIERGVSIHYVDSKQRNLIMRAVSYDTDIRLQCVVILADAGCDINHTDMYGWSCLHHACASGAADVVGELFRRGVEITHNPFGYGPEDFIVSKILRASSLLEHTEQKAHEECVRMCWEMYKLEGRKSAYGLDCDAYCFYGKPLKVHFRAPEEHSVHDRIRIFDRNSDTPIWMQTTNSIEVPPGSVGTITLDAEILSYKSNYRILYEAYKSNEEATDFDEDKSDLQMTNLDTGTSCSIHHMNELVEEQMMKQRPLSACHGQNFVTFKNAATKVVRDRAVSATIYQNMKETEKDDDIGDAISIELDCPSTHTSPASFHPDRSSISKNFEIVAMAVVQISSSHYEKADEYEIVVRNKGSIGLHLEPVTSQSQQYKRLIVRNSSGQAAAVSIGDYLIAINSCNIEHAGIQYTTWQLYESSRPLTLRFRRGINERKKSMLPKLSAFKLNISSNIII